MSRNMAPWIVPATMSWGVRTNLSTVRQAILSELAGTDAPRQSASGDFVSMVVTAVTVHSFLSCGAATTAAVAAVVVEGVFAEALPGESQEDLIEGRPAKGNVVHGHAVL